MRHQQAKARFILGFIIGPLIPGFLVLFLSIFSTHAVYSGVMVIFLTLSALLGYPIAIVFGLPLYFLLGRRGWVKIYHYIGAGLLLGVTSILLFCAYAKPGYILPLDFLKGAISGGIATASFWLIARPDELMLE